MPDPSLGKNHSFTKRLNRQTVLGLLRGDVPLSRAEISRLVRLSPQAVSNIIEDLALAGLVAPIGKAYSGGAGQPPTHFRVVADCGFGVGFHLDQTSVRGTLIDLAYAERAQLRAPLANRSADGVRRALVAMLEELVAQAAVPRSRVWGVGIASPRLRNVQALDVLQLEGEFWSMLHASELDRHLAQDTGLPVIAENDANAGALGEATFGHGQGVPHFCYLFLGHGLGCGLIQNGAIYRGGWGNAGEVGRILIQCGCGYDTLESVLSVENLLARIAVAGTEDEIGHAAECLRWLVSTLENTLDPRTILIGSVLPAAVLERLIARAHPLHHTVASRSDRRLPRLQAGVLDRDMIALGAATTPLMATLEPDPAIMWTIRGDVIDVYRRTVVTL